MKLSNVSDYDVKYSRIRVGMPFEYKWMPNSDSFLNFMEEQFEKCNKIVIETVLSVHGVHLSLDYLQNIGSNSPMNYFQNW